MNIYFYNILGVIFDIRYIQIILFLRVINDESQKSEFHYNKINRTFG